MTTSLDHVYRAVARWAQNQSIRVREETFPAGTAGEFNGTSVSMNPTYDAEERAWYLVHALGSIVLWSYDPKGVQTLFDTLRAASKTRQTDPTGLEQAITRYREFETESSSLAVWLLDQLGFHDVVASYTNFMRADLEALTEFHRHGKAPVWRTFFHQWNQEVQQGRRIVVPFAPKPVPSIQPIKIERQQILQEQGK